MSAENNFKLLGQEEEDLHPHPPPEIEDGVMGNVRVFGFVSNVVELYLSRILDMFIAVFGGTPEQEKIDDPAMGDSDSKAGNAPEGRPK